jgi:hypothetical protein
MGYSIVQIALILLSLTVLSDAENKTRKRNQPMESHFIEYEENSADQALPFSMRCSREGGIQMLVRTNRGLPAHSSVGTYRFSVAPDLIGGIINRIQKAPTQSPVSGVIPGEVIRTISLKGDGQNSTWYATESKDTSKDFKDIENQLVAIRNGGLKNPLFGLCFHPIQMKMDPSQKTNLSLFFIIFNSGSEPVSIPYPGFGDPDETIIELNAVRSDVDSDKLSMQDQIFIQIPRKDIKHLHSRISDEKCCSLEPKDSIVIDCSTTVSVRPGPYKVSYNFQTVLNDINRQQISVVELFGEVPFTFSSMVKN